MERIAPSAPLPASWFSRDATQAAPDLVGRVLVHRDTDGTVSRRRIVETEAYMPDDPACHAYLKVTNRTRIMYGPPGHAYVYLIYGMHHCLNFVTGPEGSPQAVLVRALEAWSDEVPKRYAGPGRVCRALGVNLTDNGALLDPSIGRLWVEESLPAEGKPEVVAGPRIGISQGMDFPWRWYWKGHKAVSVVKRAK